ERLDDVPGLLLRNPAAQRKAVGAFSKVAVGVQTDDLVSGLLVDLSESSAVRFRKTGELLIDGLQPAGNRLGALLHNVHSFRSAVFTVAERKLKRCKPGAAERTAKLLTVLRQVGQHNEDILA